MKYSILLPSYDPELKNHDSFMRAIKSIDECSRGKDYELVIRKNCGNFVDSLNDCWQAARGEFLIFVHDDMVIEDPQWLEKFSIPGSFMTTRMGKFWLTGEPEPTWSPHAMHRSVLLKVGLLDERFKAGLCSEDDDYIFRMRDAGIPVHVVDIKFRHEGGMSNRVYRSEVNAKLMDINNAILKEKWNL